MAFQTGMYQQQAPNLMGNVQQGLAVRDMIDDRAQRQEDKLKQEQMQQAFGEGLTTTPDGQVQFDPNQTVGALAQVDPSQAFQAQQQFQAQDFQRQQQEAQMQEQQMQSQLREADLVARALGGANDDQSWQQSLAALERAGIDTSQFPSQFDENFKNTAVGMALSTKEQLDHRFRQRQLDQDAMQLQQQASQPGGGRKAPAHYRWTEDGDLEPIPGGEVAREIEAEERQRESTHDTIKTAGTMVVDDGQRALDILERAPERAAGWGSWLSWMPKSQARKLQGHIDSVKGNIAVDQLLKIKREGAGLGQVPQSQLMLLSQLLGNLDAGMGAHETAYTMRRVMDVYSDIVRKVGGDPHEQAKKRGWTPGQTTDKLPPLERMRQQNMQKQRLKTNEIEWAD